MLNRFQIEFRTGNSAFENADGERDEAAEVARILRDVANAIERGTRGAPIHDSNGNRIGRFDLERADD
jgi:hypothetical protein